MTKAQALARYGKPKKHTVTDEGEQWVYILNMGEVIGKAFIPFNFKATPIRTDVLSFGTAGVVTKFTWDTDKTRLMKTISPFVLLCVLCVSTLFCTHAAQG